VDLWTTQRSVAHKLHNANNSSKRKRTNDVLSKPDKSECYRHGISTELENVVAQYPGVLQCAVIGIPDARWGEAVHAIIVVKAGTTVDVADLIAFCKERIAGYKCPHSVDVRTDPLPMSGAGKILKRELRRPFWEGQERHVA